MPASTTASSVKDRKGIVAELPAAGLVRVIMTTNRLDLVKPENRGLRPTFERQLIPHELWVLAMPNPIDEAVVEAGTRTL